MARKVPWARTRLTWWSTWRSHRLLWHTWWPHGPTGRPHVLRWHTWWPHRHTWRPHVLLRYSWWPHRLLWYTWRPHMLLRDTWRCSHRWWHSQWACRWLGSRLFLCFFSLNCSNYSRVLRVSKRKLNMSCWFPLMRNFVPFSYFSCCFDSRNSYMSFTDNLIR